MKKEIKKIIVMSAAIAGALYACAKEELLRYPDSTRAKLVAKESIIGKNGAEYVYRFDMNESPDSAEMFVYFPKKPERNADIPLGSSKTVADIRFWAAQIYSVNTSTPKPEYKRIKGRKVLVPEKCEYIQGLYKSDPPALIKYEAGSFKKRLSMQQKARQETQKMVEQEQQRKRLIQQKALETICKKVEQEREQRRLMREKERQEYKRMREQELQRR